MPSNHNNSGIPSSTFILVKRNAPINSFATALAFLKQESGQARFKLGDEVQVGVNSKNLKLQVTQVMAGEPNHIGLVLYDTVVLTYRDDETFTVNSGGYLTPTTVTRLNQFSPEPYRHRFCRKDRSIYVGGHYADKEANRFTVAKIGVVGKEVDAPVIKRKRAKVAHGTIRWLTDSDGNIISTNNRHQGEAVFLDLQFSEIGRNGDFTTAKYLLKREVLNPAEFRDFVGIFNSQIPLDLINAHRLQWNMPEIKRI